MAGRKKLNSGGAYSVLKDNYVLRKKLNEEILLTAEEEGLFQAGIFLTEMPEQMPIFEPAPIEKIWSRAKDGRGDSGARIVLTKDNFGHRGTGLGGIGATNCEAIDIVAGALTCERSLLPNTVTRANFISDAARIYLTERGDVNHYFCLGDPGNATSISSKLKSGIGIKADHSLVIGRERVRILCGLSNAVGQERLANLNRGFKPMIEIGEINGDSQPAVLGTNLCEYLREQDNKIDKIHSKVFELERKLIQYKAALALHFHTGAGIGAITTVPSIGASTESVISIPKFFKTTTEAVRDTLNSVGEQILAVGIQDGPNGTPEKRLLSGTVYIGK